jgi:hypothetical protein
VSALARETTAVQGNLATVLAGAEAASLAVQVQTTAPDVVTHTFALPGGEHLIAIWNDGVAKEEDAGIAAALTVPGFAGRQATGVDPLHSLLQPLITRSEGQALVIENLRVKDYVLFIRLGPAQRVFLPSIVRN